MREYALEISKYTITFLFAVYSLFCYLILLENNRIKNIARISQNILLFLLQFLMFMDLVLVSSEMEYVFFYLFVQIFLLAALVMVPMIYEQVNRPLLNAMCMLLGCGLMLISRLSFQKAVRQYIIILISFMLSLFIPYLLETVKFWKKMTWIYGFLGITILGVVLLVGEYTHGSKITFSIYGITFQPSEFSKILLIFFLAAALWEKTTFLRIAQTAAVAGCEVLILAASKDLGGALIFFVAYVFMVFMSTGNYFYLALGMVGGSIAAYVAFRLFTHVQTRVYAWMDPWSYIDSKGYAITQSLFAIGSGSWFGMGLMQGSPKSIPYVDQDFIFSAFCEELGIISGICLILIIISCFLNILQIALQIRDRFYQLIVYGIGIVYLFQIFLTVGGGINLIPLTGVTLPFISYGGSSCMTTMFMFFIVQGIYIRLQKGGTRPNGNRRKKAEDKTSEHQS